MPEDSEKTLKGIGVVFLVFTLCILAFWVFMLLKWWGNLSPVSSHLLYANLVIMLGLLLSHIAVYFMTRGWPRRVITTIVLILLACGLAYLFWIFRVFLT